MTQKPAGVHENGGVYLHASVWRLAADAILGRHKAVQRDLLKILPFHHAYARKYCEPYIMTNSYFPAETGYREGTAGQSWRTASGAWLAKALVCYVFGLQATKDGLRINACIPSDWERCRIQKDFRGAKYEIEYIRETGVGKCARIEVDGEEICGNILPYAYGKTFSVCVHWVA